MKLAQLFAFAQVYTSRSYSKAAEVLEISQPAVSQSVKSLEDELGVTLLTKSNGRIHLTAAGDIVYDTTKKITNEIDTMKRRLVDLNRTSSLYHMDSSALAVQRELIPYMQKNRVPFLLQYDITSERESIDNLLDDKVDIIATQRPLKDDKIECMLVETDTLCIYVPEDRPIAQKNSIHLEELAEEPIVFTKNYVGGSINDLIINFATEHSIPLKLLFQGDFVVYRQLQESPEYSFFTSNITRKYEHSIEGKKCIPIEDPELKLYYYVSYLKKNEQKLSPLISTIKDCFNE